MLVGATIEWLGSIDDDDIGLGSVAIFAVRAGGYFVAAAALAELRSRGSRRRWMLLTAGLGSIVLAVEFGVSTARYVAAFHSELPSGFIIAEVVRAVFVRPAIFALMSWLQLWTLLGAVARYRDSSTRSTTDDAGV
jgi:hypothetical protein